MLPSLTNSRFPRLGAAEADAFLVDVVAEAAATRALRDTVYAPICASNATANDAVLASAFYAKVLAQPEGTRLMKASSQLFIKSIKVPDLYRTWFHMRSVRLCAVVP